MTASRKLNRVSGLVPESRVNVVMEQNPSKKTELMSETGADVKLF